jgi:hypothetical protein
LNVRTGRTGEKIYNVGSDRRKIYRRNIHIETGREREKKAKSIHTI